MVGSSSIAISRLPSQNVKRLVGAETQLELHGHRRDPAKWDNNHLNSTPGIATDQFRFLTGPVFPSRRPAEVAPADVK